MESLYDDTFDEAYNRIMEAGRLRSVNAALLKALEDLLADYETDTPKGNHECHSMKQARAAIAKAKAEQS